MDRDEILQYSQTVCDGLREDDDGLAFAARRQVVTPDHQSADALPLSPCTALIAYRAATHIRWRATLIAAR